MPMIGMGTCCRRDPKGRREFISALEAFYATGGSHIDTAQSYDNHADVKQALSAMERDQVWVTSKVNMLAVTSHKTADQQVRAAVESSLIELGVDQVDLMLLHEPACENNWQREAAEASKQLLAATKGAANSSAVVVDDGINVAAASRCTVEAWRALVKQQHSGKCRAVGVSNFGVRHLSALLGAGLPLPAVNEVEFHPWVSHEQYRLVEWCHRHRVAVTAFGSFGSSRRVKRGNALEVPAVVAEAARVRGVSAHEILLAWTLQQNISVIPQTNSLAHMRSNLAVHEIRLTGSEIKQISTLGGSAYPKDWKEYGKIIHKLTVKP
ncbi:hypothetical protein CYMTET_50352 [Cymbomonas tetramitiformis]|uniref:NADP-dependent oxidoreductase domain-containing protein n=1 Tax=Cymbomonas tetramitiformis TaxID=36881 RepID=A0AAE0BQ89_9CHLO|nr:hypothetical protein CYMTET_50352 [Cymbomonas tetramitiformis]